MSPLIPVVLDGGSKLSLLEYEKPKDEFDLMSEGCFCKGALLGRRDFC